MAACEKCSSTNLVTVALTVRGDAVDFAHCRACEHRWWRDATAGTVITLPDVLTKVAG